MLLLLLAAALQGPSAWAAETVDFDQGFDLSRQLSELRSRPVPPAPPAGPARPGAVLGEPLDPSLVTLGDDIKPRAKADWQRRIKANGGKAALAPLGPIDPAKKLMVFIPGIGLNFQDAHALARAEDSYQVVFAIYNQRLALATHGEQVATALEALVRYRADLARARGLAADRELRLLGHSYGGLVGQLAIGRLVERGLVHSGPDALLPKVLFVCIDAGWRGFDAPWIFALPGIKHLAGEVLPRLPLPKKATRSALTVMNRTSSMNAVLALRFPENVTVELVNIPTPPPRKRLEPVDGWLSSELGPGELERLWRFLRAPSGDGNRLDAWALGPLVRQQGLQQLWATLERDVDFAARRAELYEAAVRSKSLAEFRERYDEVILRVVDTFQGQHTQFMWTDPAFMPWLRGRLAAWPDAS
ncbi:MAG: hypothetical protein HY553_05500 [Elusimicrobia bacterium]|nr:hypothetical protein [Elusimicrobiota bacterium]